MKMKAGKKLLSLLLCFAMILTSVSVGFTSFAAMSASSITKLASALKSETVKNLTYSVKNQTNVKDSNGKASVINSTTVTLKTYREYSEMLNILTLISSAIEATNEFTKYQNYNSSDNGDVRNCSNVLMVKNEIMKSLQNANDLTSAEIAQYHIDTLFDNIFSMENVSYYHGDECYSKGNKNGVYERVHDYFVINTDDYKGYLASLGSRAQVDAAVQLGAKLTLTMCRQNYETGNIVTTSHYHYAFNSETQAAKEFTASGINTNSGVKSTVDAYASYLDSVIAQNLTYEDMLTMVKNNAMSSENGFKTKFNEKMSAIKTYVGGDSTFNKLYSDYLYAIDQIQKDIASAEDFDTYKLIAKEYTDFMAAHPAYGTYSYGSFDKAQLVSDYNAFLSIYYKLLAGGQKMVSYLAKENMIDLGYYNNFTDNVLAYDLAATANKANDIYNRYKDTYADLTFEEQRSISSLVAGYIRAIESYTPQVQATFFPNGHGYLVEFKTLVNCKINDNVVFFIVNTKETLKNSDTDYIIKINSAVENNINGLNRFYNEVKAVVGEERANELLGDVMNSSRTLKDDLYAVLAERFTSQVDAARQLYTDLNEPEVVNAKTAAKLGEVFADLEDEGTVIYNYLQNEGKAGLISAQTIEKYNYLNSKVLEKYKQYLKTFGLSSYEQTTYDENGVYAVRKPYENDIIKTEDYVVTKENLQGITDSLDKFLSSDTFKELIGGKGIDELIMGLLEKVYSDDVVNLVVQYVYPLVANELVKIWDTLPSSIQVTVENVVGSLDVDVDAGLDVMSVENATETLGLYLFPKTLANHISKSDFPDVVEKLSSVKTEASADNNPWESRLLYNADGKLDLKWGVTDKESFLKAIDAALKGLEPLLMTLLSNRTLELSGNIGTGSGSATALGIHIKLTVDPLTINLKADGNSGYNNTIAPIIEALGLTAPNGDNYTTVSSLFDDGKSFVTSIVKAAKGNDTTLGVMLDAAITDGIYKDEVLRKLLEAVVKLFANVDRALIDSAGALLDVDFDAWFGICDIVRDADGKVESVVCTKNWGIDQKTNNAEKKAAFIAAFTDTLAPISRVLEWLFFGEDYRFLNSSDGSDLIVISGGNGFDYGVVPILEALGCKNVKTAADYYENGTYNVSKALGDVVGFICDKLTEMCGDDTFGVMLDMLPNFVYFVNAGGVSAGVKNILGPVTALLEKLSPLVGEIDLDEAIGFPITNIRFNTIFDILADEVGLNFKDSSKAFVESFYMGKVEKYTSANGEEAFRMTYSDTETRREMITILLSLGLENIKYDKNEEILKKWFGEDIYQSIINVLNITKSKEMQDFSWYNTEYADTDKTFTGLETSNRYSVSYDEYWTKDKAVYQGVKQQLRIVHQRLQRISQG